MRNFKKLLSFSKWRNVYFFFSHSTFYFVRHICSKILVYMFYFSLHFKFSKLLLVYFSCLNELYYYSRLENKLWITNVIFFLKFNLLIRRYFAHAVYFILCFKFLWLIKQCLWTDIFKDGNRIMQQFFWLYILHSHKKHFPNLFLCLCCTQLSLLLLMTKWLESSFLIIILITKLLGKNINTVLLNITPLF